MGSIEDKAVVEMEHESLVNPGSTAVKKPSFELSNGSSDVSSSQKAYATRSSNGVIESIKIVVFSTKLNVMIIFGPLAIVVDKTSGAHVSFCLFLLPMCLFVQEAYEDCHSF